jgi:uncharacterized membrane protein
LNYTREKQWILIIIISTLFALSILIIYGLTLAPHGSSEKNENLPLIPKYILSYVIIIILIALVPLFYLIINIGLKKNNEETMKKLTKSLNENSSDNKKNTPDCKTIFFNFLNYHEKQVIKKLIEQKGNVLQSDISRMNNMGKVKAHREVRDLEKKGVINIEKYGNTNRIILNEEMKKILKI